MRSRVSKWGNSLGVRIPRVAAEQAGLQEGADVEIKVSGNNLVVARAQRRYSLDELVSRITSRNRHDGIDWGRPVGREIW